MGLEVAATVAAVGSLFGVNAGNKFVSKKFSFGLDASSVAESKSKRGFSLTTGSLFGAASLTSALAFELAGVLLVAELTFNLTLFELELGFIFKSVLGFIDAVLGFSFPLSSSANFLFLVK